MPNSLALGEDFARNLDDALKAQFARCTAEPACKQKFGDPDQTLYQLRDALRANPHEVSFRDPQSYRTVKRMLDEDSLASVVRMFAYTPATAALLPLSIDAAARGDVGPLLGQAKLLSGELSELMGSGMQYSVICSEDADLLSVAPAGRRDHPGHAHGRCAEGGLLGVAEGHASGRFPCAAEDRQAGPAAGRPVRSGDAAALRRGSGQGLAERARAHRSRARRTASWRPAARRS